MSAKIRVFHVDPSPTARRTLSDIISSDSELSLLGAAVDFRSAEALFAEARPDIIVLDMDRLHTPWPEVLKFSDGVPILLVSSVSGGTHAPGRCPAVKVVKKPHAGTGSFVQDSKALCSAIRSALKKRLGSMQRLPISVVHVAEEVVPQARPPKEKTETIIVIGASTGGPEALKDLLSRMPVDSPGIVVVQHMPEKFTGSFAKSLDNICLMRVKEAEDDDHVEAGRILIAPGGRHLLLKRVGNKYRISLIEGPPVSRHKPSVDVLFTSAARQAGANAIGVILTGMGDDGARGLLEMKKAGAHTIAQDERSCVVFGMPKEAIEAGAVDEVKDLDSIGEAVLRKCG